MNNKIPNKDDTILNGAISIQLDPEKDTHVLNVSGKISVINKIQEPLCINVKDPLANKALNALFSGKDSTRFILFNLDSENQTITIENNSKPLSNDSDQELRERRYIFNNDSLYIFANGSNYINDCYKTLNSIFSLLTWLPRTGIPNADVKLLKENIQNIENARNYFIILFSYLEQNFDNQDKQAECKKITEYLKNALKEFIIMRDTIACGITLSSNANFIISTLKKIIPGDTIENSIKTLDIIKSLDSSKDIKKGGTSLRNTAKFTKNIINNFIKQLDNLSQDSSLENINIGADGKVTIEFAKEELIAIGDDDVGENEEEFFDALDTLENKEEEFYDTTEDPVRSHNQSSKLYEFLKAAIASLSRMIKSLLELTKSSVSQAFELSTSSSSLTKFNFML